MSRRKAIIILIIVILIFWIIFVVDKKKISSVEHHVQRAEKITPEIVQDEETGEYVIYRQETGEEIARSEDKSSLSIYEIDPDYNPRSPSSDEIIEE
ncbi:MAG: hypothetical protein IJ867_02585 [Clostridia bacterium]|nr:hypothetical protein [Clostridia bacterium]